MKSTRMEVNVLRLTLFAHWSFVVSQAFSDQTCADATHDAFSSLQFTSKQDTRKDGNKLIMGDIFHFIDNPFKPEKSQCKQASADECKVTDSCCMGAEYIPNGGLLVDSTGHVLAVGKLDDVVQVARGLPGVEMINKLGKLIMPGFFDLHVHLPQLSMTASAGYSLLPWLGQFVYETEAQFANETVARYRGEEFLDALIAAGTTTAAIYMTIHKKAVELVHALATEKKMRILIGKVGMDRCRYSSFYPGKTDPPLCDTAEDFYLESAQLIEMFREKQQDPKVKSRVMYVVAPRYAPSSTPEQLAAAGKLLKRYPEVYFQTHLSENYDEIALVRTMYGHLTPAGKTDRMNGSYLEVYDHFGLVTNRSIFGHVIHLSQEDWDLMGRKGGIAAHCPTSNLFLGSGLFNFRAANASGAPFAIGSDVGAGTSLSSFRTMNEAYKVSILGSTWLSSLQPHGQFLFDRVQMDAGPFDVLCPPAHDKTGSGGHWPIDEKPRGPYVEGKDSSYYKSHKNGCCACDEVDYSRVGKWTMPAPEGAVQPNNITLTPAMNYYMATLGGARALGLQDKVGSFFKGSEADIVVIDPKGTSYLDFRLNHLLSADMWSQFWESAGAIMILGSPDVVEETYIMGVPRKKAW
ncbi:unnamed protein product [Durusdinium trenchii]|uniref:Amidohydrolase-related domain-containing protein n=3 Tax=Durusdinium trenchii TaxID=1381693 RepID=A0ABP0N940_9DINO